LGHTYKQGREWRMTVYEYTKSGDRIDKKMKIKPTQEMQEVLDTFWNTVKSITVISTPYSKNLQVENYA